MPNISNIVRKHWNILNISRTLQGLFQEEPSTDFKRHRKLKKLIGSNCIENGKIKRAKNTFTIGKCSPCSLKTGNLCCSQLTSTTTFIRQQTKKKFKVYHKVNCKSEYVIYLMECTLCNKQYVEKAETGFNINLNNHRNNTKNAKAILACRHFQEQGHNFNSHAKFEIIEKLILPALKTFYPNARLV